MAILFNEKLTTGLDCETCSLKQKQIRHCYGVEWRGNTKYIVNTSKGQRILEECPKSFVARYSLDFQFFLDCFFAVEKGIPLSNNTFFELPNRIVRYLEIIYEERDFYERQSLSRARGS